MTSASLSLPPGPEESDVQPLRLLVVEDVESDFDLLVLHLRRHGFRPVATRVQSAAEMRLALAAGPWDFVISDYNVPGFGALPALELLRASGLDVPFVLVSGAIGEEAAVEAMRAGAEDYVPKDHPARLAPAIRRGLAAAAQRRQRRHAEEVLSALAQNLPGMLFRMRTRADGGEPRFVYASGGGARLFAPEPEALLREPELFLGAFDAGERERFGLALSVAARERSGLRAEFRLRAGPEGPRWIQVGATAHAQRAGLAFDGVVTDVTALKQAEARLLDSQGQLRRLTDHLQRVKETERAEIAREVHDEIGGTLTAMKVDLAVLERAGGVDPARIDSLRGLLDGAMQASQRLARSLRPAALDQGLYPALRWQAREFGDRHGIAVTVTANEAQLEVGPEVATALFRILQEGLTNIARHARAGRVEVNLFADAETVSLEIRDDGRGIEPAQLDKTGSFGVFGMYERVRNLGGWLEIDGAPGHGTTLMVSLPRARPPGGAP